MLGGAPVSNEFAETVGADAYAPDAVAGVNICKEWITEEIFDEPERQVDGCATA